MRVSVILALLLLSSSLVAQTVLNEESKQAFSSDQVWQAKEDSNSFAATGPQTRALPDNPARCFFIRSYNFERRGTTAPRLKNMTTCTPAKTDQFRQTERRPKVRLIPAS